MRIFVLLLEAGEIGLLGFVIGKCCLVFVVLTTPFKVTLFIISVCYFWAGLLAEGTTVVCCLRGFGLDSFAASNILVLKVTLL